MYVMKKKFYIFFVIYLVIMSVLIWTENICEQDNKSNKKYEMIMQEDESKEFMSISFKEIDTGIE